MKKILLIGLFTFCFQVLIAQQNQFANYLQNKKAKLDLSVENANTIQTSNVNGSKESIEETAKKYLLAVIAELQNPFCGLRLLSKVESNIGIHLLFIQTFNGTDVYQSTLKVNLDKKGNVLSVFNDLSDARNWKEQYHPANSTQNKKAIWAFNGQNLSASFLKNLDGKEEVFSATNELIFTRFTKLGLGKTDTILPVKIFNPDPLTTARSPYQAPYLNYNRVDSPALNIERKELMMKLKIDTQGNFLMENEYVILKDLYSPATPIFSSSNPLDFIVTRATNLFKQEMVLYHTQVYNEYLKSLGFNIHGNQPLLFDPHGAFGEASKFDFDISGNPYIVLAVDYIPDAEDADVIWHEYTHAINYFAAPNTTNGEERIGIDEGCADIMAVILSRKLSDYNWRKVFNWDGNNFPSWTGRTTAGTKNYKTDFANSRYSDCEIWSSAIVDIAELIGHDIAIELLFTSVPSFQNNMTQPQAAKLFLQADSLLFNKMHYQSINKVFFERGYIDAMFIENTNSTIPIQLVNSIGFADGSGNLEIISISNEDFNLQVIDINGRKIFEKSNLQMHAVLNSDDFKSGIYFLKIESGNKNKTQKIVKF